MEQKWWMERPIYQIYPRSFCDSNNDGIGDIPGIISKLDYLKDLGVGGIWLSPVYRSPNDDMGYDISDYYDINPEYGTLADMKTLFAEAKKRDIHIIMDLVINHTSDEHPWFRQGINPQSPYHDYYIWMKGKTDKKGRELPPNNWQSMFTGTAWEKNEANGQYYLHLFTKKQPDLNYHNPKVIEEVKKILRFWLDLGASGFRCDVINLIYKESFADGKRALYKCGEEHYLSKEGCHRILKEFHDEILAPYDAFTVGETADVDLENAKTFTQGELTTVFPFDHTSVDYRFLPIWRKPYQPAKMIEALVKWQTHIDWNPIFFENHDLPRSVSRFGTEGPLRDMSAKMLATVLLLLRGTPFIYEGEELGMINVPFRRVSELRDVSSVNVYRLLRKYGIGKTLAWHWILNFTRDHSRTPMPWNSDVNGGFSTVTPWLMANPDFVRTNVKVEQVMLNSVLNYYRELIKVRAAHPAFIYGTFRHVPKVGKDIFAFEREYEGTKYLAIINMGDKLRPIKLTIEGKKVVGNYPHEYYDKVTRLRPYEAVVVKAR